jgi:hypothetical protein
MGANGNQSEQLMPEMKVLSGKGIAMFWLMLFAWLSCVLMVVPSFVFTMAVALVIKEWVIKNDDPPKLLYLLAPFLLAGSVCGVFGLWPW